MTCIPIPGSTITVQVEPQGPNTEYTITIRQPCAVYDDGTTVGAEHNATFRHVIRAGEQGFGFLLTEESGFWTLRNLPIPEAKPEADTRKPRD